MTESIRELLLVNSREGLNEEIIRLVGTNPTRFAELFLGLLTDDIKVQSRAAHAMEAISRLQPELLANYGADLIKVAASTGSDNARWHIAAMLPRAELNPKERSRAVRLLASFLEDESRLVRVNALQGLAELSDDMPRLRPGVVVLLKKHLADPVPSVAARARRLLRMIEAGGRIQPPKRGLED